jgi:predicted esterase
MVPLISEINSANTAYMLPQAAGHTWYPYRFIEKREMNDPDLTSAINLIDAIVEALIEKGKSTDKIYLLGFSQGACLVSDYAARYPARYGGVIALSGGLIGDHLQADDYQGDLQQTPVFLGCSDRDMHIPESRVEESAAIFMRMNARVTKRIYPHMGHTVNQDEVDFVKSLLGKHQKERVAS